jgi:hypothetical protein
MYLTDGHRLLIRETLQEIEETPPPAEPGVYGCGLAIVGLVVLVGFGIVSPRFGVGAGVATPILVVGGGALVIGMVLSLTRSGFTRKVAGAATEAALSELEDGEDDEDVLLRAATLLLAHAFVASGETMRSTFDRSEAALRIGERMPLVRAVEEYLTSSESMYPVFTTETSEDPSLLDGESEDA